MLLLPQKEKNIYVVLYGSTKTERTKPLSPQLCSLPEHDLHRPEEAVATLSLLTSSTNFEHSGALSWTKGKTTHQS